MKIFNKPIEFEWDSGNQSKNLINHHVTTQECEEVFFDPHKKTLKDVIHSAHEDRFIVIGKTKKDRLLFIVFTIRDEKLRVISARDLNKRERDLYEERN